jgi:hypothetical protein
MAVIGNNYSTTTPPKTTDGRRPFGCGNYQVFNSNSTFTVPCGITKAKVHVYGAGGGGGLVGGGGAGGGYGSCILTVTPGCVCNVAVGIGGTPGTNASYIGANGTLSCFGVVVGCGGQGGCSFICNTACAVVPAANGGGAVGTTAFKGGNGSICVDSGGGGSGSPLGAGGAGGAVIQGGGGGVVYPGCIGGGGTGGPGGTSLGGADLSGIQRLSSGNLYDKDVIGRFPGDIISGGGGGCLPGTGGIGGGAGGVGPSAGICVGLTGGYFGGAAGGIACGGQGGCAGGGGGAGYGACGVVSFAHGTGLMVKCCIIPSALQSIGGAANVGVGAPNTSLCIMGAGLSNTGVANTTIWTQCSTDGNYYYCDISCHTVTHGYPNYYMKNWIGTSASSCIIQNGNVLHYLYLDACVVCNPCLCWGSNTTCLCGIVLKAQTVCLASNSTAPFSGANICGTATTPYYCVHVGCSCSLSAPTAALSPSTWGAFNWQYIPCKNEIFVIDTTSGCCCCIPQWYSYCLTNTGTTCICCGGLNNSTVIVRMATCNTTVGGFGCCNCGTWILGSVGVGQITPCCCMMCIPGGWGGTSANLVPSIGMKFRCHLYVPNCATSCSFVYTGFMPVLCRPGIGFTCAGHALIINRYGFTAGGNCACGVCVPFAVGCNNDAISTILVNAKCQLGCIPASCPDVYYYSADNDVFHKDGFGCKMYGLTTDPTCWCYNQASCWANNKIHPATLTYIPQSNVFVAFSDCTDTYAYSNTLQGDWTFATHCAVKCLGGCYWQHCDLQCSFMHPHRSGKAPPVIVANNRIALLYYNCASGSCCSGILVTNNISCSTCWTNITCAANVGWCTQLSAHYVPYLDRIFALTTNSVCLHISSATDAATTFTSCNICGISGSPWCAQSCAWNGGVLLYNKYGDTSSHTCNALGTSDRTNFAICDNSTGRTNVCYGANNVAIVAWNAACCSIGLAMSCNGTTWATAVACWGSNIFPGLPTTCCTCDVVCNIQVVGSANNTIITGKCSSLCNYWHFNGTTLCPYPVSCVSSIVQNSCPTKFIHHNGNFLALACCNIGLCTAGSWTCTPSNCVWTNPTFFTTTPACCAGVQNVICTQNCSAQTCFIFIKTNCAENLSYIARSADMCTWTTATTICNSLCTCSSGNARLSCYNYDPCYDLFFWAYTPGGIVAVNNDLTSVCCNAGRNVFNIGVGFGEYVQFAVTQASICNAQRASGILYCRAPLYCVCCIATNSGSAATPGCTCVYNICSKFGPGGITLSATTVNMIPKCDFTITANPIYCFDGIAGPMLVISYCTTTKCFTMCNYPFGWTDVPYSGTYCSSTNYTGTGGCGGNGMVIVEY